RKSRYEVAPNIISDRLLERKSRAGPAGCKHARNIGAGVVLVFLAKMCGQIDEFDAQREAQFLKNRRHEFYPCGGAPRPEIKQSGCFRREAQVKSRVHASLT